MHLKWVKHAFARDNNLLRLFLYWQTSNESSHFLSSLPLGQLTQSFLSSPYTRVDDLEEQLAGLGVEDKDGSIDGFRGQITLKCLVNCHSVYISVIDKPDDLIGEKLGIVLRIEVRFGGL